MIRFIVLFILLTVQFIQAIADRPMERLEGEFYCHEIQNLKEMVRSSLSDLDEFENHLQRKKEEISNLKYNEERIVDAEVTSVVTRIQRLTSGIPGAIRCSEFGMKILVDSNVTALRASEKCYNEEWLSKFNTAEKDGIVHARLAGLYYHSDLVTWMKICANETMNSENLLLRCHQNLNCKYLSNYNGYVQRVTKNIRDVMEIAILSMRNCTEQIFPRLNAALSSLKFDIDKCLWNRIVMK